MKKEYTTPSINVSAITKPTILTTSEIEAGKPTYNKPDAKRGYFSLDEDDVKGEEENLW